MADDSTPKPPGLNYSGLFQNMQEPKRPAAPQYAEPEPPNSPVAPEPELPVDGPKIINTASGKKDGLDKCPRCGSTEIGYSIEAGALVCSYCRHTWNEDNAETKYGFDTVIEGLIGTTLGSGSSDITEDSSVVTIKCQGCGAEVIIKADTQLQSRCHWCRQVLSLNTQVPNGAVPDGLLPFSVTHDEAVEEINKFVNKRRLFAWGKFKKEFTPENVVGVFMPYMVIDGNLSGQLSGKGEIETRRYTVTVGSGDNKREETRYDADIYEVNRKFDFTVDDLITESSQERSDMQGKTNTNNVINAILPFDIKNAVAYNSNYMGSFTSERRDMNMDHLNERVEDQFLSIARAKATEDASQYDRGIRWETEGIDVHGTRWVAVYLPVWLYSYYVHKSNGSSFVHYIAVNGRSKRTMGSIPVSQPKLIAAATLAALAALTPFLSIWI